MKSKFFVESGYEDSSMLERMLECSDTTFNVVLDWFMKHDELPRLQNSIASELLPNIEEDDPDLLTDVVSAIYSIVKSIHKYKDNYEDYVYDFGKVYPKLKEKESFHERLMAIEPLAGKYIRFFEIAKAQNAGAPVLTQSSLSIAMKPIIENKYDYDDMSIESYKPKIRGYSPVAMLELKHSGSENTFSFQVAGKEFDRFLNELLALKLEIAEVEKEWKI